MPRLQRAPKRLPFHLLLPSIVTIIGLSAGLTAIRFTFDGRFEAAAALIVFAAVIDGLDGLIARRLKAVSRFGAELDSLSDFVCFGVAPGMLVYQFALGVSPGMGWTLVLVFVICCCLRLARFNISRDEPAQPGMPAFVGVPAPAGAMMALFPVFLTFSGIIDLSSASIPVALYIGGVGLLMVSKLPTLSPKAIRIKRENVPFILIGMALVVGILFTRFWLLMVLLVLLYMVSIVWVGLAARRGRHPDQ